MVTASATLLRDAPVLAEAATTLGTDPDAEQSLLEVIDSGIPADAWPQVKLPDCDEVIRTFPEQLELFSE